VVKQLAVKHNRATQAQFQIADVDNRAMSQLVNEIHVPARTLVVFNTLNWKRDALVETDLRENEELVDLTTHHLVPVESVTRKQKFMRVRFMGSEQESGKPCILRSFLENKKFGLGSSQTLRLEQQIVHIAIAAATPE
jgi:hypothetical protein